MNKQLVSIIIPVYCRLELAIEAIDSALLQDYNNIEIIVGDNCSPDGTYEKLTERYGYNSKVKLFQNSENLGAVGNWEECLKRTSGDFIKILWSDDLMAKDFVSKAVEMFNRDDKVAFVYSSVYVFQKTVDIITNNLSGLSLRYKLNDKTDIYSGEIFIKASYYWNPRVPVSPGCAIFRKDKLKLVLDIPNKISYQHRKNGAGPDQLMFLEALANGEKFGFLCEPLNYFREHSGSISSYDNTISEGYWTAKLFYLKEHDIDKYWTYLNSEIIATTNKKRIFSRSNNRKSLLKYYDSNDSKIYKHSVISVFIYKLRNRYFSHKIESEGK